MDLKPKINKDTSGYLKEKGMKREEVLNLLLFTSDIETMNEETDKAKVYEFLV